MMSQPHFQLLSKTEASYTGGVVAAFFGDFGQNCHPVSLFSIFFNFRKFLLVFFFTVTTVTKKIKTGIKCSIGKRFSVVTPFSFFAEKRLYCHITVTKCHTTVTVTVTLTVTALFN
jgi:hypothetical protein